MRTVSIFVFIIGFGMVFGHSAQAISNQDQASQQSWNFRVLLNDTPIGYHRVNIKNEDNRREVHTTASFDVRFLLIPVYSYEHETRETWHGDCLASIESKTDDNGDNYFINSKAKEDAINFSTQNGNLLINGCVRTFAYWDLELLKAQRLLNTQTGEYQVVTMTDLGSGQLVVDEGSIQARHFRLVVEDMAIDLWYSDDMHWLALESETESGDLLRYLPENVDEHIQDARS